MLNADMFRLDMQDEHMSGCTLKPDFLISVLSRSEEQLDVYSMETKTPKANKGDMYFVKLANTMKTMVDELVSRG